MSIYIHIIYDENDNESEVSKSSIESNADKKAEKLATKEAAKEAKEAKEAKKLAAKEAKEAENKRSNKETEPSLKIDNHQESALVSTLKIIGGLQFSDLKLRPQPTYCLLGLI